MSKKKWDRGKAIIERIQKDLKVQGFLNHTHLERDSDFWVYLSRTYKNICPYFKDIHQTLDSWWNGKDNDGWKLPK